MRLALLPALLCLPSCIFIEGHDEAGVDAGVDAFPWPDKGWGPRITEAGWSFGECIGLCEGHLWIQTDELTLRFRSNDGETSDLTNRGILRSDAIEELDALAADVIALRPEMTYGCPDCDDGGAAHLTYTSTDELKVTEWEYGAPPPELAAAAAFLFDDLIRALTDCVETDRVTLTSCSPPGPRPAPARAPR